jgi:hypothetical protein
MKCPTVATPLQFGGWLLLPTIGLIFRTANLIIELVKGLQHSSTDLVPTVGWLILTSVVGWVYARKHHHAPMIFIAFLAVMFLAEVQATVTRTTNVDGLPLPPDLILAAVMALIWIPYFLRSQRVKATFVR